MNRDKLLKVGKFIDCKKFCFYYDELFIREMPSYNEIEIIEKEHQGLFVKDPTEYSKIFFISHRWDNDEKPDLTRWQIKVLISFFHEMLSMYSPKCCFWYDYSSLPQKPRNEEQENIFKEGLQHIDYLCSTCEVISLISSTKNDYKSDVQVMMKRGWIFAEMAIAKISNKVRWCFYQNSHNALTTSKTDWHYWNNIFDITLDSFPYYDKRYINTYFENNGIVCTNGKEIKYLVEYLYRNFFFFYDDLKSPEKLEFNKTYHLTDLEISKYYISKNGITGFFLDQYFEIDDYLYKEKGNYVLNVLHRPELPEPEKWIEYTESEINNFRIDSEIKKSKMYPGIIFNTKEETGSYFLQATIEKAESIKDPG